jgi:hypothetical protein
MDRSFTLDRIAATKAQIAAYEDAVLALTTGGVAQYSIDTGQTRQSVTKIDVVRLNAHLDGLYNRLATLEARVYGGTTNVRPAW